MPTNVGQMIVAQLHRWGVERVFGLSGSSILPLIEGLRRDAGVRYVTVRHEETAALMASAYAKFTGRLGVCVAHAGPGAAHLINGLYDARQDHAPVLALTGQISTQKMGTVTKQSSQAELMFGDCVGFSRTVAAPSQVLEIIWAAMRYAISMEDVAHVALPSDILASSGPGSTAIRAPEPFLAPSPAVDLQAIRTASDLLTRAQNPVIVMGRGAISEASNVLALAEKLNAPLITSLFAKGSVPEDHPLVMGPIGEAGTDAARAAASTADAILILGSTWWPASFMPANPTIVQVDLRPTAIGAQHPVQVGLVGPISEVLVEIQKHLSPASAERKVTPWRHAHEAVDDDFPWHPARVMHHLRRHLPSGAIVAVDTGLATLWYGRTFPAQMETTLISGRWRTMGFALPAALAAQAARPDAAVVALVGDGGMGMTGMEFVTAVKYHWPIVVVVLNNAILGEEAARQEKAGTPVFGMDLLNPDFSAFAEACGGVGFHPCNGEELDHALHQAFTGNQPTLIDVKTRYLAPSSLMGGPESL